MLLIKTLRSSTLKLAFFYVTGFSTAIFAVLGFVYWNTVGFVRERSDRLIAAENAALLEAYRVSGRDGLIALVDRRGSDSFFDDWVYLLAGPSFAYVAGNLPRWPANLRPGQGWTDFRLDAKQPHRTGPVRATYRGLPDGFHLLVGRRTDVSVRFWPFPGIALAVEV